jgi:hypothetical protein
MFHHCLRATQEISIPNQLGKAEFVAAMLPVFKAGQQEELILRLHKP